MNNHSISRVIIPCQIPTGKRGTGQEFKNLTGRRFGRLVVNKLAGKQIPPKGRWYYCWECLCDCGTKTIVSSLCLNNHNTKSCGCLRRENSSNSTHRMSDIPEYYVWSAMKNRCNNPNDKCYRHYGGRGISVCKKWLKFECFIGDMGRRPGPKYTLERRNNNGNYEPSNCCWATIHQQRRNTRRTHWIIWKGKRMCLQDWCAISGIKNSTFIVRIKRGWSEEKALNTPLRIRGKHLG